MYLHKCEWCLGAEQRTWFESPFWFWWDLVLSQSYFSWLSWLQPTKTNLMFSFLLLMSGCDCKLFKGFSPESWTNSKPSKCQFSVGIFHKEHSVNVNWPPLLLIFSSLSSRFLLCRANSLKNDEVGKFFLVTCWPVSLLIPSWTFP